MQRAKHPAAAVNEDLDFSPEAIKLYLIAHIPSFIRYIEIRAKEKGGFDKLFDGNGRFVLSVKDYQTNEKDNEETKNLILKIKNVLEHNIIRESFKQKLTKWQPELTPIAASAVYIDLQHRYFGFINECTEWKDFVENNSSVLSKEVVEKFKASFCLWIVFSFLDKLEITEENISLKNKAQFLVKIINGIDDFRELVEMQKSALLAKLNQEFARVKVELTEKLEDKKHNKQAMIDKQTALLTENFEKILLDNWLQQEEKENIAIDAIGHFMGSINADDKLERYKETIYTEVFNRLKTIMKPAKNHTSSNNLQAPSQGSLFAKTDTVRTRSKSTPAPFSPAVMSELSKKLGKSKV